MLSPTGSVVVVIRLKANEQHHSSLSLASALFSQPIQQTRGLNILEESKMERIAFRFSFLFLLMATVSHGAQYPWSGSSSVQYQQTPYRRMSSISPAAGDLTPYNERLDAKEWLDKLLDSLTSAEPLLNGVSEQRSPEQQSPQRIFQREARPSLTFVQNHPTGKRRFSLASVRVNPTSLKRQHIFAAPNMALLELENPARIPNRFNTPNIRPTNIPRPVHQQQRPRDVQRQPVPTFRQQEPSPYVQTYQQGADDYLGHSQFTFENPAASGSTTSERHLDVDVYVNHHA